MDRRAFNGEPACLCPIGVGAVPTNAPDWIDDPDVRNSETATIFDLLLNFGVAIFRREHLDGDELRLTENRMHWNFAPPDADVGDANLFRPEVGSLLLSRTGLPLFVVSAEAVQNRPLHKVVLVLARASFLDFALDELRVGLKLSLQILAESNACCRGHTPNSLVESLHRPEFDDAAGVSDSGARGRWRRSRGRPWR